MAARWVLHGFMLVTKDEKVNRGVNFCLLLGVLVKAGVRDVVVIAALHFVVEFFQTMLVRPTQGQTDTDIRMYMSEQPLVELTFEHLFQEFVALVPRTSSITVDQKELLAFDGLDDRFAVQLDTQFIV